MPYNSIVSRVDAAADLAKQLTPEITAEIETQSTVLAAGREVPLLSRDNKVPVLASTVDAYFVTGDSGLKQTSSAEFANESITAEEIAVIVPIPKSVVEDADVPLFDVIKPLIARAMARKIDAAILFGASDKPASWGPGLVQSAIAAGHTVTPGSDLVADLLGAAEMVADDEHAPTGALVRTGWEFAAARQRTDSFNANPIGAGQPFGWSVGGLPVRTNPVFFDRTLATAIVADWSCVLYGFRRAMTFEMFDSGVLTDASGAITHNLLSQGTIACRATMRIGWHLAQPATQSNVRGVPVAVVTAGSTSS